MYFLSFIRIHKNLNGNLFILLKFQNQNGKMKYPLDISLTLK